MLACCCGRGGDGIPVQGGVGVAGAVEYRPWERRGLGAWGQALLAGTLFSGPGLGRKPLRVNRALAKLLNVDVTWVVLCWIVTAVTLSVTFRESPRLGWPARFATGHLVAWGKDILTRPASTLIGVTLGLLLGLAGALVKMRRLRHRRVVARALRLTPGPAFVRAVLDRWPEWVDLQDAEQCAWLNRAIENSWPFYDQALAENLAVWLQPPLERYKPPYISRIEFKRINFGSTPLCIDSISAQRWVTGDLVIDASSTWSSDADIQLMVKTVPHRLGDFFSRHVGSMIVKVQDISFKGRVRIIVTPLVGAIPPFGGFTVSFLEEPLIRYRPTVSGGVTTAAVAAASPVIAWISHLVTEKLVKAFVWPDRQIIDLSFLVKDHLPEGWRPQMMEPKVTGCLDVVVIKAEGLEASEGRSLRSHVDLFVRPHDVKATSARRGTSPVYNERFQFLIKEPAWEKLHVAVAREGAISMDKVIARGLLHVEHVLELVREDDGDDTTREGSGAKQRGAPKVTRVPTGRVIKVPLGPLGFDLGCGAGKGVLHLNCTFISTSASGQSHMGAVVLKIFKVLRLPKMDVFSWCDPYIVARLLDGGEAKGGSKSEGRRGRTAIRKSVRKDDAVWFGETFEWFDVRRSASVVLTVMDYDAFTRDEVVGTVTVPIETVISTGHNCTLDAAFPVESGPGKEAGTLVEARIVWVGLLGAGDGVAGT